MHNVPKSPFFPKAKQKFMLKPIFFSSPNDKFKNDGSSLAEDYLSSFLATTCLEH